jgi:hypothetical protein
MVFLKFFEKRVLYIFKVKYTKMEFSVGQKYIVTLKEVSKDQKPKFESEWLIQIVKIYDDDKDLIHVKFLSGSDKIKGKLKNIIIDRYNFEKA